MARKKRDDGRVQVQIDLGVDENGKRQRKSFYGKTLAEARDNRDAWVREQERKRKFAHPDITLNEWSQMWLRSVEGTTEAVTYRSKRYAVNQQNAFIYEGTPLGDYRLVDITPMMLQTYMNSLSDMSRGTITHRRTVMKAILRSAVDNDVIEKDPWRNIKCPKGTYEGHRALTREEQNTVIDMTSRHRCGIWALAMMFTGMRREELAAIDASDIDWKRKQINIHRALAMADGGAEKDTKSEAGERVVPIFDTLYEPLRNHVAGAKHGLVFLAAEGGVLTSTAFTKAWKSYMLSIEKHVNGLEPCDQTAGYRRAAVMKRFKEEKRKYIEPKHFTAHDLRDTYATILYDAGVDVKTAAYLMGHADITVTMKIYTKLSAKKKREGLDALKTYINTEYGKDNLTTI